MPHPLYLQIMGIGIHEYNSYSPKKKARFQKEAHTKLNQLHESDIDGYTQLTEDAVKSAVIQADEDAQVEAEDKEGE
jgi:hypothetical protein